MFAGRGHAILPSSDSEGRRKTMSKNFSDYDNLTSLFTEIRNKNVDIEKNIAPVESDASSSSRAYAVNSRLILGDKLYKVIAAIDIGDALIVDTNIELSSNLVTLIGQGGGGASYYAGPGINISDDNVISSKAVEFAGTQAEWDALSTQEKSVFDYINITDDTSEETYQPGHSISDGTSEKTQREVLEFDGFTVTDDSVNGKTKVAEVPYTAGDGVEITEKEISVSDEISRTWTGTKAEWDAIADKSVYDGWIINITDDQASGVGVVVDTVEEGNMNPVTSNAVYSAVDDIADTLAKNVYSTLVHFEVLTPGLIYTVPEEGYLNVISNVGTGYVIVQDANGNQLGDVGYCRSATILLKKGMKVVLPSSYDYIPNDVRFRY
jgi:hypothetical protein